MDERVRGMHILPLTPSPCSPHHLALPAPWVQISKLEPRSRRDTWQWWRPVPTPSSPVPSTLQADSTLTPCRCRLLALSTLLPILALRWAVSRSLCSKGSLPRPRHRSPCFLAFLSSLLRRFIVSGALHVPSLGLQCPTTTQDGFGPAAPENL